jgi:hypothetical protein
LRLGVRPKREREKRKRRRSGFADYKKAFGAGISNSGGANALLFNVDINQGTGGLFGSLTPFAADLLQGNDQ